MDLDLYLTPIKIRGKKRKHAPIPVSAVFATKTSAEASQNKSRRAKKQRRLPTQNIAAMPTLLGLPQELLEIIFLYSMNISLPCASPLLGRKLSSRAVTLEYTMRAFFHTVDHKTNYRDRKKNGDRILQSQILSCRFFTWDFFLKYVDKSHDAMVTLRGKAWEKTGVEVPGVRQFDGLWPFKFTTIPYLSFAEGFHVPEKLLHGPWDRNKVNLLYVLVSLNGEIDWEGSMAGETAKQGIREAVAQSNERAVAALSTLLGVPKQIDTGLLRYAVLDCGGNPNILRHLLFNAQIWGSRISKDVLDFLDTRLWAWADANGERGDVLKHMLRKADAFDLEFYFDHESNWTTIIPFPYSGSKFDTRTTFDDVVRELLMNLYWSYGRKITRRRTRQRDSGGQVE
ncbi:actin cortical patch protein [Stagonosporopsis vannaccii]|nr:actin cortical patch protein [Stagonosporopsis vannaccii]